MWRKLLDVCFWLGTSLYFGGILVVGVVVAPAVFDTARTAHLSMPGIADPPLETATQVGGEVFGNILNRFAIIEVLALSLVVIALAGWILSQKTVRRSTLAIAAIWLMVAGLTAYDAAAVRPEVWSLRQTVRAQAPSHAAEGANALWTERARFNLLHARSENLAHAKAYLLLAMLLIAAWRGSTEKSASASLPEAMRQSGLRSPP